MYLVISYFNEVITWFGKTSPIAALSGKTPKGAVGQINPRKRSDIRIKKRRRERNLHDYEMVVGGRNQQTSVQDLEIVEKKAF